MRAVTVAAFAVAVASPRAAAQGSCRPELVHADRGSQQALGPGRTHYFASGAVLIRCIGQSTTLRSDSLAWFEDLARMDFVGNVRFEDDTVRLTANQIRYFTRDERLDAAGDVRLFNKLTHSTLTGPTLSYWRAVPEVRDTSVMLATGRPTVQYRSRTDLSQPAYVIVGDRVRLAGGAVAGAGGAVTIERSDFAAASDSASLNFEAGTGMLVGHAQARSTDTTGYAIEGRTIAYRLEDDALRWVQARGSATATSSGWRVVGDTIEFDVTNERVQGGRVWSDSGLVHALSERHTVEGDSLAIDSPNQELREVRAYGHGRATARRSVGAAEVDWVAGDTVIAGFAAADSGPRLLDRLEANGSARAYYHVFGSEADSTAAPAIAYSRGRRITVGFKDDALDRVNVLGQADGVYLEPRVKQP